MYEEINFFEEFGLIDPGTNRRLECYLTLLESLIFNEKKFEEIPHDKMKQIFSDPQKFKELEGSFKKIFSRSKGKSLIPKDQQAALIKWYGLKDGKACYEYQNSFEKLGQELKIPSTEARGLVNKALRNLKKPENFNLLPQEVQDLAKLK